MFLMGKKKKIIKFSTQMQWLSAVDMNEIKNEVMEGLKSVKDTIEINY